jgi:hypothetical protein
VILVILSAAISAALFTAAGWVLLPHHDIEGFEVQAAAEVYALAIVALAFFFLVLAVPATVLLRRRGLANWINFVAAGAVTGAIVGFLFWCVPDPGTGPMPLYTWWRFTGWGAAIGVISSGVWALLERRFRGA